MLQQVVADDIAARMCASGANQQALFLFHGICVPVASACRIARSA